MTVLYVITSTGLIDLIAASKDERKLEEKMYEWCEERNIKPEYYHGDYRFYIDVQYLGRISGWLRFETVEIIERIGE